MNKSKITADLVERMENKVRILKTDKKVPKDMRLWKIAMRGNDEVVFTYKNEAEELVWIGAGCNLQGYKIFMDSKLMLRTEDIDLRI